MRRTTEHSSKSRSKSPGRTPRALKPKRSSSKGPSTSRSASKSPSRKKEPKATTSKIKAKITPLLKKSASSAMAAANSAGMQARVELHKLKDSVNSVLPRLDLDDPDSIFRNRQKLENEINHEIDQIRHKGSQYYRQTKTNLVKYTSQSLEFGGPLGNAILMIFLPAFVIYMLHLCERKYHSFWKLPKIRVASGHYFDTWSAVLFLAWILFQAILYAIPWGYKVKGFPLTNAPPLTYQCNGFIAYFISITALGVAVFYKVPVWKVCDKTVALATTSIIFSFLFSLYLYVRKPNEWDRDTSIDQTALSDVNVKGKRIYRYFMGRYRNPRVGSMFDLKFFFEMRPGLIGWVVLDLCYLAKKTHEDKIISLPLLFLTLFQAWYVLDAQWHEARVLSTWDIKHENLGFMLLFGDIVWVPFLYTLQARYLSLETVTLPKWYLGMCVALYVLGYAIFRIANSEKYFYQRNPSHLKFSGYRLIPTSDGNKKLLAGGLWGFVRHPNYLGDIIIALAMCLITGYTHVLPYFYLIFLTCLLVHRELRDEQWCRSKYGNAWNEYCRVVKYRIIPYIF